jgi:hypothetical protein
VRPTAEPVEDERETGEADADRFKEDGTNA